MGRDATLDGVAAQPPPGASRKQRILRLAASFGEPHAQDGLGLLRERDRALLASFAFDADMSADIERDVAAVDRDELGDPEPGLDGERQHRAVAAAFPAILWWSVNQRLGLGRGEEAHGALLESFGGDAQHACDHGRVLGVMQRGVAKQRSDGGESQVARACTVVALVLEVLEKGGDQRLVELVPVQRRWRRSRRVLREAQQHPERVAVGRDRAGAGIQLLGETVAEERL